MTNHRNLPSGDPAEAQNPFAPPAQNEDPRKSTRVLGGGLPDWPQHRLGELRFEVAAVEKRWTSRRILLQGLQPVEIRYAAMGIGERVYVDGVLASISSTAYLLSVVAPRVDFYLPMEGCRIACQIEVTCSWLQLFRIIQFSLTIAGSRVYQE